MPSTVSSDLISHDNRYAWLGTPGKSVSTLTRDGVEVRRNLDPNPGFEVDTSTWGASAGTTGVNVFRSATVSHSGAASLQVRWQSPNAMVSYAAHTVTGLQDDTDYMVSLWVSVPKRLEKPVMLSVTDGGTNGPNAVTLQEATPGWQKVVIPYRTLVGSTGLSIWLFDPNRYTGSYLDQSVYIDDVLIETGSAVLPYFDGSTPSYVEFENTQPLVVNGWGEGATGRNIVNPIIGGGIDVTLQAASLRQGAFELVYQDEDEAAYAFAMHQRPSTFTITDAERPSIAMTYVVDGRISRTLDDESRDFWIVRVEYQEV